MYYRLDGVKDVEGGKIMGKWVYIGVGVGLIGTYAYLGLLKSDKQKLVIASLLTFGGLEIGRASCRERV